MEFETEYWRRSPLISQTLNGVIFPLLHFQQQLYRSNMSLWHKRTPSGSVSLCLNCNRYPGYDRVLRRSGEKNVFARVGSWTETGTRAWPENQNREQQARMSSCFYGNKRDIATNAFCVV